MCRVSEVLLPEQFGVAITPLDRVILCCRSLRSYLVSQVKMRGVNECLLPEYLEVQGRLCCLTVFPRVADEDAWGQ